MASETVEIFTKAQPEIVWDAIRDVGALHTRLVPGFVVQTELEPGARIVTFGNGMRIREPIITVDEARRRLVWSAEGVGFDHYNASVQVFVEQGGSRVVWIADYLPDEAGSQVSVMMQEGIGVLKVTMDQTVSVP